jgi:alkylresorcinol/alkylpyrone synthase
MTKLTGISTAVPTNLVSTERTKVLLTRLSGDAAATRFAQVVDSSRIRSRYSVATIDELFELCTVQARAERYAADAVGLAERVAHEALVRSGVPPNAIDLLISVSNTGYMMPSLDAHLIDRLELNRSCRRIPITELGCHAGVSAVALAAELLRTPTARNALVVVVELCSLCLQVVKPTDTDILGSVLFGDGAAAAVMVHDGDKSGLEIVATRTLMFPDSLDRAGLHMSDTGLRLVLSPALPSLVRERMPDALRTLLEDNGLTLSDISFWVAHPGGPKILDAISESLGLPPDALACSWAIWEECGNVAAATVLFILERLARTAPPPDRALGIMVAFGPGLTCELILLRWHGMPAIGASTGVGGDSPQPGAPRERWVGSRA